MKKRNLLLCLILSVALCFTMGSVSAFAATYTADDAPEVKLGETFSIDIPKTQESQSETEDVFAFKFTPDETGSYKVSFDTTFDAVTKSETDPAVLMFFLIDDPKAEDKEEIAEESGGYSFCMSSKNFSEEELEASKEFLSIMGISFDDPTFTAELKAGTTYYLVCGLTGADSYKSNVTITTHVHDIQKVTEKAAYVKEDGLDLFNGGGTYEKCKDEHCNYYNVIEEYPAVESIELSKDTYAYTGKAKKPVVTIKDINGDTLKKNKDYTVSYSSNTAVGKAKVVIQFKGNYKGKYTKTFKINPAKTTLKTVTSTKSKTAKVTWNKSKYASKIDGYQVRYSTSKDLSSGKNVTIKGGKKTSTTIKSLKAGKKYYFKVRTYKTIGTKKYYSEWSKVKSVKVKK